MFPFRTWRKSLMWTPAGPFSLPLHHVPPVQQSAQSLSAVPSAPRTEEAAHAFPLPPPPNGPRTFSRSASAKRDRHEVPLFFLLQTFPQLLSDPMRLWPLGAPAGVPSGRSSFFAASWSCSAQLQRNGQVRATCCRNSSSFYNFIIISFCSIFVLFFTSKVLLHFWKAAANDLPNLASICNPSWKGHLSLMVLVWSMLFAHCCLFVLGLHASSFYSNSHYQADLHGCYKTR